MTREELQKAYKKADEMMKETKGHSFMLTGFKTRCQFCGRSPRQKGICKHWFQRYLDCLEFILTQ